MEQLNGLPSDFIPREKKALPEYAIKYCQAAWSQKDQSNYFNGYNQSARIRENRNVAAGINNVDRLKSRLGALGNSAYANLNYDVQSPVPNVVNNIIGSITNQPMRLDVQSGVLNAQTEFDKEYNKRLNFYKLYLQAPRILEETGVDIMNKIPEKYRVDSEKEIELQMTEWRDASCVALEDAVNFVERKNDAEFVNEKIARDLVENAIAATHTYYDINGDIVRDYVDIEYLVTSWTDRGDFKDVTFAGTVKFIPAHQLIAENKFQEEELKEIIRTFATKKDGINSVISRFPNYNPNTFFSEDAYWKEFKVAVLYLDWKTTDKVIKEEFKTKNGGYRIREPKPNGEKRKGHIAFTEKYESQVYTAKWIIDSQKVYDNGIKPNQLLEEPNSFNKQLGFTIYSYGMVGMKSMSIVDKLKVVGEQYQIGALKAMGVLAKISPPKTVYDISAINATIAGLGKAAQSPKDIQDIAEATGVVYTTFRTQSGKTTSAKPVYELNTTSDQLLPTFFQFAEVKLREMETIIGVPLSTIGAMDKDALVGIEKLKAINRNNSLIYINNAYKSILTRTAEKEIQMIIDSIDNSDKQLEDFQIAIGKLNTEPLQLKKRVLLRDHNIYIKALPDAMEIEEINQLVIQSLQGGIIKASDALYIREIAKQNPDKVRAYLKYKEDKYEQLKAQQAAAASQAQAEAQAQAQAQIEGMKAQTEQLKKSLEAQMIELKAMLESKQSTQDFIEESKLKQQELQGELEKIRVATEEAAKANQLKGGEGSMKNTALPASTGVRQPKTPQGVGN